MRALQIFRHRNAPLLQETAMMSMPVVEQEAVEQMVEWATGGGNQVRVLFGDPAAGGPSLVWSWFGPDYILPRHSHSADCLYYVTRGELRMGNNVLQAGDGFFVPSDAPYAYTAGPNGVEILEFRTTSPFDMQISESLPRWDRIVEGVRANRDRWASAARGVRD
jgi:hypothetical protein